MVLIHGRVWEEPETVSSLTHRTDTLLLRLSLVVGREVFYAALWGSALTSPSIRLPASLFVVNHISRDCPGKEQKYMLGTDHQLAVGAWLPQPPPWDVGVAPKGVGVASPWRRGSGDFPRPNVCLILRGGEG